MSSDASAPIQVTIGTVQGSFYPNPSGSGAFPISPGQSPAFTEQFQTIDFNPPLNSDVQSHCTNATGINETSRPFADVIPQGDGSCRVQTAQSGDGSQQAGVGNLFQFAAVFTSTLTVAQAGQITFNFYSDDGWVMAMGQGPGGAQPTYVAGSDSNPPAAGPFTGYPVVGSYNQPSAPTQNTVTVNFPSPGAYPIEVDYTEIDGGPLALTLGTAYRNPILPQSITGPANSEELGGGSRFSPSTTGCAGEPVNCDTGDFWHTFDDLAVPGRGIPLAFTHTYNSLGAGQDGPLGYGWTDTYNMFLTTDATGVITETEGNGSGTTFSPTGSGGYQPASHVQATLTTNGDGTFTLEDKRQHRWIFAAPSATTPGLLLKEIDRNGYTTTLGYDAAGHLATITDPAGRALTVTTNAAGHIASVGDPIGRTVQFAYDSAGNLIAVTDVAGGVTHFTYDSNHLLLTMTDPKGGVLTNVYDGLGRVSSQTDPMNRTIAFGYTANADGSQTSTITDPDGNVTTELYENNELISLTKGSGTAKAATWTYSYDPTTLNVVAATDPNQHTTRYTYDTQGNTLNETDALNRTSAYTYDALNDLTSATDPNGVTTQYNYDAAGNLLSAARPLTQTGQTATTTLTYDAAHPGDVVAITDPDGHTWRYAYDAYGNVVRASDPLSDTVTDRYDLIGRKIVEVSPTGNMAGANPISYTTTITYNAFGETTASADPLGHQATYQYDPNQNLLAVTDALGHTTHYGYDADNERTTVTRPDSTMDRTAYDGDGNVTVQVDGLGRSTTYAYDPLNRVVAVTDPLTRTTTYGYDAAGNEITVLDPLSRTAALYYDAANQLIGVTHSDGTTPNVAYTYTPDGQRATMSDGTGTTTYTYDSLERLVHTINGAGQALGYGYDLANNLVALTYPDGSQVTRVYDAANRMTAVSDWLGHTTRFAYDADGNLVTRAYPNTTTASMSYNAADQLTGIVDSRSSGAFWTFAYSRDGLGQLAAAVDPVERLQHSYSYDALNRLIGDQRGGFPSGTTSGSYDAADQLTTGADTASHTSAGLTYDAANELTRVHVTLGTGADDLTMGYNADGDRTTEADSASRLRASAGYDQADRLITVTVGATTGTTPTIQAQYAYNGDGLRMSKVVSGTADAFTWDLGDKMPLLIQDGTTRYVTGPDGLPVEQIAADGTVLYYYQDQLGSTRGLLDASGRIVAAYAYGPYGVRIVVSGHVVTPFGYAGQYTDAETGLQYLRARYYDPTTAQFLSRDPLVQQTGLPYTYGDDNPVNRVDPTGLWTIQLCLTASAAWGWQVFAQGCIATANLTSWGVTGSLGAGGGSPSASVTGGAFVSNANHIADLNGPFGYIGVSGGEGPVVGVDTFLGSGECGQLVVGGGPSVGVGANLPVPAEFHGGVSDTWSWVPIGQ